MHPFLSPLRKIAKMGSPKAQPNNEGVAPLHIIFSCSVCGDTLANIYKDYGENVQGLSDGINPKDRLVTRLYVSACCHVICIKHIENGNGPHFHPAGERPRAPCPVCINESGESRPRELYSVRGFKDGEYDPAIPKHWFSVPPMKLDSKDKDMEALRFQYLALIRYSKVATTALKYAEESRNEAKEKLRSMEDIASREHAKVFSLEQQLEGLRPLEQEVRKLYKLQARLPAVEHYLRLLPKLAEQNDLMQQRLATLGFRMALDPIPNYNEPFPLDEEGNFVANHADHVNGEHQQTASSHTVGRSVRTTDYVEVSEESPSFQTQRPLKRPRLDSPTLANNIHATPTNHDQMPPPSKPLSRMRSVRKIIPTIRKKFSSIRSPPASYGQHRVDPGVRVYENGHWGTIEAPIQPIIDQERPITRHYARKEAPYMSEPLPVAVSQPAISMISPQTLHSVDVKNKESQFTFRSPSPIKMKDSRSSNLPTEPSYIRLMDGLGRDTGLNLGIEDPRKRTNHQPSNHQDAKFIHGREDLCVVGKERKGWSSGYSVVQQSSKDVAPSPACRQPAFFHSNLADSLTSDADNHVATNPVTPIPTKLQRSTEEVDHVVSPFLNNSSRNWKQFSRTKVAERGDSLNRYMNYPFNRPLEPQTQPWREGRSLNGLSFFNSPLNERNEPIEWKHTRRPSERIAFRRHNHSRHLDSHDFIMKPQKDRLPYKNSESYESFNKVAYARHSPTHPASAIPFSPFTPFSKSSAMRYPSAITPIVTSYQASRTKSQRNSLLQADMMSGQYPHSHDPADAYTTAARNLLPSTGRRSIRR